jgi:hypothetical protein
LKAIGDAVPVRLMKRDLLFLAERLTAKLDDRRPSALIRGSVAGVCGEGEGKDQQEGNPKIGIEAREESRRVGPN